ncbi:MAG: tagaturonate epimerase family protein [Chloroflexi bacterium]|nr:tagaturonate epimerase family protein [Chloroflexota bacterium]
MGILELLDSTEPTEHQTESLAGQLSTLVGASVYPRSITVENGSIYFLIRREPQKQLAVLSRTQSGNSIAAARVREVLVKGQPLSLSVYAQDAATAAFLRGRLAWLRPATLGLRTSAGCGDRLGLATPGHIRAVRTCTRDIAPIFAQQSIREMMRTARTPQNVIDDAVWGVFQEGWISGYGADADHLKTPGDIDACVAAGYTFYTFDPGAHVDNEFEAGKFERLPWRDMETSPADVRRVYGSRFNSQIVERAFVKYGRAVAHVAKLYRHLKVAMNGAPFEVEVSVDETEQPTTHAEHDIIASELRRMGVEWVSLAPRFVGRFEKGVDYIGELKAFEADCAGHVEVAKRWGPYKLSIHSGSDKFSIYPIAARLAGQYVHLKTAGTSYLEALRTVARCNLPLFKAVYTLAHEHYAEDRVSYHVSADPAKAPDHRLIGVSDPQSILDQFDARQMLHVCFGSILARYGAEIKQVLQENEETHYADLQRHFEHHLSSFCS